MEIEFKVTVCDNGFVLKTEYPHSYSREHGPSDTVTIHKNAESVSAKVQEKIKEHSKTGSKTADAPLFI